MSQFERDHFLLRVAGEEAEALLHQHQNSSLPPEFFRDELAAHGETHELICCNSLSHHGVE